MLTDIKTRDLFARLRNVHGLAEYLEEERQRAIKYLTSATDEITLRRAQGRVLFIEEMTDRLNKHGA